MYSGDRHIGIFNYNNYEAIIIIFFLLLSCTKMIHFLSRLSTNSLVMLVPNTKFYLDHFYFLQFTIIPDIINMDNDFKTGKEILRTLQSPFSFKQRMKADKKRIT